MFVLLFFMSVKMSCPKIAIFSTRFQNVLNFLSFLNMSYASKLERKKIVVSTLPCLQFTVRQWLNH